jgi:hypothetical protein
MKTAEPSEKPFPGHPTEPDEIGRSVATPRNVVATTAGVFGIVGLALWSLQFLDSVGIYLGWTGVFLFLFAIPVGIAAVVLGLIGLVRAYRRGGVGTATAAVGIIAGGLAAVGALAWLFSPGFVVI